MNKEKLYLATKDELDEFTTSSEISGEITEEDPTLAPFLENRFNEINNRILNIENKIENAIEMLSKI